MSHISEVAVCNLALQKLGEERIASLTDDGSKASGLCHDNLPFARRKALRRFPWSFATKRVQLARATDPFIEWSTAHAIPADCVRVLTPLKTDGHKVEYFAKEGDTLLCDHETIYLKYVADVEDLTKWDDLAIEVLAIELAVRLAVPLTGDMQKRMALINELEQLAITEARFIDAVEDGSSENNPLRDLVMKSNATQSRWGHMAARTRFAEGGENPPGGPGSTTDLDGAFEEELD